MFMGRAQKRRKQIESLQTRNPFVQQKSSNPDIFHIGLRLSNGTVVTVKIILPEDFPTQKPIIQIRSGDLRLRHDWLDENQNLAHCPELEAWRGNSSDVGILLQHVMHHFTQRPPQIVRTNPPSTAQSGVGVSHNPYPFPQYSGGATSGGPRQNSHYTPATTSYSPARGTDVTRTFAQDQDTRRFPNNNIWSPAGQEDFQNPPSYASNNHQRNSSSFPAGTSYGGRERESDNSSNILLPDIPEDFPELDRKLIAELAVFEFDDKLREAFLLKQRSVENFRELDKSCTRESLKIAQDNLELEKKINDLIKERDEKREKARKSRAELEALVKQSEEIKGRFSPQAVARKLHIKAKELDRETEQHATEFVNQKQPAEADERDSINRFMNEFMEKREQYHELSAKAELVEQKGFVDYSARTDSTEGINGEIGTPSSNGTVFV